MCCCGLRVDYMIRHISARDPLPQALIFSFELVICAQYVSYYLLLDHFIGLNF